MNPPSSNTWAGAAQWCVLDTHLGDGAYLHATWSAWLAAPLRLARLHYVACTEAAPTPDALPPPLAGQAWGLLPGVHRLQSEDGQFQLTLCIGALQPLLRQQVALADHIHLGACLDLHTLKALARCCRRGTTLALPALTADQGARLAQCGFRQTGPHQGMYDPAWTPRPATPPLPAVARPAGRRALVVGAGLAGAACAWQLAEHGWRVTVLDRAAHPATGASGLPAGVLASHVSPDDSLLSRLSRTGVRTTLQQLARLLPARKGLDWDDGGVLEHGAEAPVRLAWHSDPGLNWSAPASAEHKTQAHLPPEANACWHARGGWVRPPALIAALLAHEAITWRGSSEIAHLVHSPSTQPAWQVFDARGTLLAEADLAVVCAGPATSTLLPRPWPLQALRGQIAWGLRAHFPADTPWPAHPLNGHGNLVPQVPLEGGLAWVLGSTFERDKSTLPPSAAERIQALRTNAERLHGLCPPLGAALAPAFAQALEGQGPIQTWAAVRCAAPDHLPLVGPVDDGAAPGLWACAAMGARGLTLALLCAELLAARLHGEPLPLDAQLARALASERLR